MTDYLWNGPLPIITDAFYNNITDPVTLINTNVLVAGYSILGPVVVNGIAYVNVRTDYTLTIRPGLSVTSAILSSAIVGDWPVVPTTPTLAQLAQTAYNAAVVAGVIIVSTGTPALNGTYPLDQTSIGRITSEQVYITTAGKFTNGQSTRNWLDITGTPHLFPSTTEFTAFAEAVALYDDALLTALGVGLVGSAWVAPEPPAPIP